MTLTPVRIRGKKGNRTLVSNAISRISRPSSNTNSQCKPSRESLKKKKIPAATPTIQGLPQELLELVFLYSMNPSLPRASPDLGLKLSSGTVIMEFVMRSFFYTGNYAANLNEKHPTSTGNKFLQSELLGYRFFTWSFFLRYVNKAHDALVKLRGNLCELSAVPDASAFDELWPFKFTEVGYLGFAEGFWIPEKLLHGQWTAGKASLLYVLVSFGGEIDWEGGVAGETAKEGLKEAIKEANERAVAALSVLLGIAKAITTETVLYAANHLRSNDNILRHVLFNAQILYNDTTRAALDFYDSVLWQWADEPDNIDYGKGESFKDMLREAEKFSLEFLTDGYWCHTKMVPFPYNKAKLDTVTRMDQSSRELLVKVYRNHGRRLTS